MHPKLFVQPNKIIQKQSRLFASNTFFYFQNLAINTVRYRAVENNVGVSCGCLAILRYIT